MSVKSARNNWEGIWNDRNIEEIFKCKSVLEKLMIANGHIVKKRKVINVVSLKKIRKKYNKNSISGKKIKFI